MINPVRCSQCEKEFEEFLPCIWGGEGVCIPCYDRLTGYREREVPLVACPFCEDTGFDLFGLKIHLVRGWCESFNQICVLHR